MYLKELLADVLYWEVRNIFTSTNQRVPALAAMKCNAMVGGETWVTQATNYSLDFLSMPGAFSVVHVTRQG